MSLKKFRDAGLTKVNSQGKEQFYIVNANPDPQGRRVYCVVANDMSLNELVPLTKQEYLMLKLAKGDQYTFEDWTECFNIQPEHLELVGDNPIYGRYSNKHYTYETLMQYDTLKSI